MTSKNNAQNTKRFLYLVQSRIKFLSRHYELETADSDVLILTFEEKIDQPNFIYAPNTNWTSGRNKLIEQARKLDKQYDYYVFLDDDVKMLAGSFREFEQEALKLNADFVIPKMASHPLQNIASIFKYNIIQNFDDCFLACSKSLFFADDIFPYEKENENPYYASILFAIKLHLWINKNPDKAVQFNQIRYKGFNTERNEDYLHTSVVLKEMKNILDLNNDESYKKTFYTLCKNHWQLFFNVFINKYKITKLPVLNAIVKNGIILYFSVKDFPKNLRLNQRMKKRL